MIPYHWSLMKKLIWLKKAVLSGAIWKTVTGSLIHITDALASPVNALSVSIDPVQSGSGDPSPENVRPISGYTEINVFRTGKNIYDRQYITQGGNYVNLQGTHNPENSDSYKKSRGIYLVKGQTYRVYCNTGLSSNITYGLYALRTGSTAQITIQSSGSRKDVDKTYTPAYSGYYCFWLYSSSASSIVLANFVFQLQAGDGAYTGPEAYSGQKVSVTFPTPPGTVYGGTLDVINGVLTVTHGNIASYAGEALPGKWISSMDVYSPGGTPTTGAQVVYELATPQTYQLTPQEVSTLLGENNIWVDTGDTTLTYMARG